MIDIRIIWETEILYVSSSLPHHTFFSPSALFRLSGTEMLPAAPVSNFSKLSLSRNLLKQNTYAVKKQNKHTL